jgi:DNA-directed RNA polymerase specialized sigma24 family protein
MPAIRASDDVHGGFPPTRWTLVMRARERPELRREALGALLGPRWNALYVLGRRKGLGREQAEDAVQSFFERLLDGDLFERLEPSRGRLRSYLRTAFQRHLINLHASEAAHKRGGGRRALDIDAMEEFLASSGDDPERLFDRAFAISLFESALADLRSEFGAGERTGPFSILEGLFRFGETAPYAELAAEHGLSVPQLKAFVHRAKRRLRELLRRRVAETVESPEDVDVELAAILGCLGAR